MFIYEYIGEVVNHATFMRRMAQYKAERERHFYFMMLQREEYIDATRRGAKARFINHSCSPNCYVSKWHVGKRVRMGIFAKRAIRKDEELTFNYNVDRYGCVACAGTTDSAGAIRRNASAASRTVSGRSEVARRRTSSQWTTCISTHSASVRKYNGSALLCHAANGRKCLARTSSRPYTLWKSMRRRAL